MTTSVSSLSVGDRITLQVSRCLYACCGGGWKDRPYEGTYTGTVESVAGQYVILTGATGLGRAFQLVATYDEILDCSPAVD